MAEHPTGALIRPKLSQAPAKRGLMVAALASALLAAFLWLSWRLWPIPQAPQADSHWLLAEQGQLLAARLGPSEQWQLPSSELPQNYVHALVRYEDRRFWQHPGVDPLAMLRALQTNAQAKRVLRGGSTLSMQAAGLLLAPSTRDWRYKIQQIWLAMALERQLSKDEILLLWANQAPMGGNIIGLEAASWRYFQQPAQDLTWAQASLLAVLPNHPGRLNLARGRPALLEKRNRLLRSLAADGLLSSTELQLALSEPLPMSPGPVPQLAQHLLAYLPEPGMQSSQIDWLLQQQVQQLASHQQMQLLDQGIHNLSVIVLDYLDPRVLAYLGNGLHPSSQAPWVDINQQPRSYGSLLKPLLYAHALDQGRITSASLLLDIPQNYSGYQPRNHDHQFLGLVRADHSLQQSRNLPFVMLLDQVGIPPFLALLQQQGLSQINQPADHYGLSLILGGAEASPWQMAELYANLARRAQGLPNARWSALHNGSKPPPDNISSGAAWLSLNAMRELVRPGQLSIPSLGNRQEIAWKTGTSFGLRDGWAIGVNGQYLVAVWVGNAQGESAQQLSGTFSAAPLMFDLFKLLPQVPLAQPSELALRQQGVCDDGYLSSLDCPKIVTWLPREAELRTLSPFYRQHWLNSQGQRVDSSCWPRGQVESKVAMQLRPLVRQLWSQAQLHPEYPWAKDCLGQHASIELPNLAQNSALQLPQGELVLEAVLSQPQQSLYWYLNHQPLRPTHGQHQQSLALVPGEHELVLISAAGERLVRRFSVLP